MKVHVVSYDLSNTMVQVSRTGNTNHLSALGFWVWTTLFLGRVVAALGLDTRVSGPLRPLFNSLGRSSTQISIGHQSINAISPVRFPNSTNKPHETQQFEQTVNSASSHTLYGSSLNHGAL